MPSYVNNKKGKKITLLNPSEKGKKYADEIRNKRKLTNDFEVKKGKDGKEQVLTREEQSYRAGYLDAQKDSAKAYKHREKKKKEERAAKRAAKKESSRK